MRTILQEINKSTFVLSDHHFGHKKLEQFEPMRVQRAKELGYENFEEMQVALHNQVVSDSDLCVFLGDFAFSSPAPWVKRLKGRKILIIGNHDDRGDAAYEGFDFVVRGHYINWNGHLFHEHIPNDPKASMLITPIDGKMIAFTHYPLGFDDGYNRQEGYRLQERMDAQDELADSFGVEVVVHGHLHSKLAGGLQYEYVNTCGEHLDFTPRRLRDLIDF